MSGPFVTRMYTPPHVTGISIGGVSVEVEDGVIDVPSDRVEELKSHGLSLAPFPNNGKPAKKAEPAPVEEDEEEEPNKKPAKPAPAASSKKKLQFGKRAR